MEKKLDGCFVTFQTVNETWRKPYSRHVIPKTKAQRVREWEFSLLLGHPLFLEYKLSDSSYGTGKPTLLHNIRSHTSTATVSCTCWPHFYILVYNLEVLNPTVTFYTHLSGTTSLWFYLTLKPSLSPRVTRNHAVSVNITPVGRAVTGAAQDSIRSPGELGLSWPRLSVKVCSWPDRTALPFCLARGTGAISVSYCWLGNLLFQVYVFAKARASKFTTQLS